MQEVLYVITSDLNRYCIECASISCILQKLVRLHCHVYH